MAELKYSFEKLEVYVKAREFRKKIYSLLKTLPPEEKHALSTQMRRAAISLTNNIADGHGRFHYQESIQFFRHQEGLSKNCWMTLTSASMNGIQKSRNSIH
jgi:four helix bundle protein